MRNADKFIDELEDKFGVVLDRKKCKSSYVDGFLSGIQFSLEQQGKELSREDALKIEYLLQNELGLL